MLKLFLLFLLVVVVLEGGASGRVEGVVGLVLLLRLVSGCRRGAMVGLVQHGPAQFGSQSRCDLRREHLRCNQLWHELHCSSYDLPFRRTLHFAQG